jgi:hypothetical protein
VGDRKTKYSEMNGSKHFQVFILISYLVKNWAWSIFTTKDMIVYLGHTCHILCLLLTLLKVYMGESLSSRVSYFGLSLDNGAWTKVKSSGLCVSTGTGSTSWHLSINRITEQSVAEVLKLLGILQRDPGVVKQVTDEFNRNLIFGCGKSAVLISLN